LGKLERTSHGGKMGLGRESKLHSAEKEENYLKNLTKTKRLGDEKRPTGAVRRTSEAISAIFCGCFVAVKWREET